MPIIVLSLLVALSITGRVVDESMRPVSGLFVTTFSDGIRTSVRTDSDGWFNLDDVPDAMDSLVVHGRGWERTSLAAPTHREPYEIRVRAAEPKPSDFPGSTFLDLLPAGEERRRFILDCTGCHGFDWPVISSGDRVKTSAEWQTRIDQMLGFAGSRAGFPIMSSHRYQAATASFLSTHVRMDALDVQLAARKLDSEPTGHVVTEYTVPAPSDLPHDLIVDESGQVVITGMMTGQMYVLDPATGVFSRHAIPVNQSNPRAHLIDKEGNWWILMGAARGIARRDATSGVWEHWPIGMYGHSLARGHDGRIWYNGHFTARPEQIGVLDPATGIARSIDVPVPGNPDGSSTIPYGLRMDADDSLWMTQLAGNRLVRYETRQNRTKAWDMPVSHSGPRRPDIDSRGRIWIPEYANSRITVFDPADESFRSYDLPVSNSLPYIARVHPATGHIWIATGGADAVFVLDPDAGAFETVQLPSVGALVRHMDIDRSTGDVWIAYGNSPARFAAVARIQAG